MATKTLNTRIALKTDTTANWAASSLVLLKGEAAFEILESGNYKIKIGDGVKTFKELPYTTMTPEEIEAIVRRDYAPRVSILSGGSDYHADARKGIKNARQLGERGLTLDEFYGNSILTRLLSD